MQPAPIALSSPRHHTPSPNQVIRVPGKQRLSVSAPRQAGTLRLAALLPNRVVLRLQLINPALLLEIENDNLP